MSTTWPRQAVVLDGARSLVPASNHYFENTSSTAYRIQYPFFGGWFYRTANFATQVRDLMDRYIASGTDRSYRIAVINSTHVLRMITSANGSSAGTVFDPTFVLPLNTWAFVVCKVIPGSIAVSMDGASFQSTSHTDGAFVASTAPFGTRGDANNARICPCRMDSLFIGDTTTLAGGDLTIEQVAAMYNAGVGWRAIEYSRYFGSALINAFDCNGPGNLVGVVSGRDLSAVNTPGVVQGHVPGPPVYRKRQFAA